LTLDICPRVIHGVEDELEEFSVVEGNLAGGGEESVPKFPVN
jgi:hypothetical protein